MGKKVAWVVRERAYELVTGGWSVEAVAREVGVSAWTVREWVIVAGMALQRGRRGGVVVARGRAGPVKAGRGYRRLTRDDRAFIAAALGFEVPWSLTRIAKHLGVAVSTVSREVRANGVRSGSEVFVEGVSVRYSPSLAHHRALSRRHRSREKKLDDPVLRGQVVSWLNDGFSPDAIAGRLKLAFPDHPERRVSHETIYQALYVQGAGGLRHELMVEQAARSRRAGRRPQSRLPRRSSRPWLEGHRIAQRPARAQDRAVPGHWEGDLVVGPNGSGLVTLVERSSRFALIGRLPGNRESLTVIEEMTRMVQGLPHALFETLTWDQGTEMAKHARFTVATSCQMFFCDPHSPWQRGSNENLNRLIREYFPKGTDFNTVTDEQVTALQDTLNTRPRKTLGYWTPSERLNNELSVALAP